MPKSRGRRAIVAVVVVVVIAGASIGTYVATKGSNSKKLGNQPGRPSQPVTPLMSVSGNQLLNSSGKPARLIGVDVGGAKNCLSKGPQPFTAPANSSTVSAMESWHINAVRMTLNESCWLGIDDEPHSTTSAQYRQSIESFVGLLNAAHMEVIMTLFADTITRGTKQVGGKATQTRTVTIDPMADSADAPKFWTSLATAFRGTAGVMFDLYNEPQMIPWPCWENGCTVHGIKVTGMQQLVNAVRATGARQPLLLGGVDFATNMSGWLTHEPHDPDHDLIASVHIYSENDCKTAKCWTSVIGPVAKKVPVITGEFGSTTCDTSFIQKYMKWSDKRGISYLAWEWITGNCLTGGPLLDNYSGTPSSYGSTYKNQVLALFQAGHGTVGTVSTHH